VFILAFLLLVCSQGAVASLRVGVMTDSAPFAWQRQDGSFAGASVDLWSEIAERGGMRFSYKPAGANIAQALEMLEKNEIDVLVGPVSVTEDRYKRFDFSRPYFLNYLSLAITQNDEGSRWTMLAKALWEPLSFVMPILLCIILGMTVFFYLFDRSGRRKKVSTAKGLFDSFWEVVLILIQGEILHDTEHTGKRVVILLWLVSSIGLLSVLIGTVTSSLTTFDEKVERSYHVLRSDLESQKIAVVKGSVSDQEVMRISAVPIRVKTRLDAVKLVQEKKVFGMVDDFLILKSLLAHHGGMRPTQLNLKNDEIAFALAKDSPVLTKINQTLLALQDTGMSEAVCRQHLGADAVLCLLGVLSLAYFD